jgi:hypothetical protein
MVVASIVAIAAAALFAAPVSAQDEEPPLLPISVTPLSGPPGTVFTFAGEDCIDEGPGEVLVTVFFTADEVVDEFALTAEADGSWSADFDTGVPAELPPGIYTVTATCFASVESEDVLADYDFADFELTAPPKPPKPPAPEPEPAKPAAPVVARPTFTG